MQKDFFHNKAVFPTDLHALAAAVIKDFFLSTSVVDTFLVVNSCARGQATPESDLDFAVLVPPAIPAAAIKALEEEWHRFAATEPSLLKYRNSHRFAQIHLDIIDGQFAAFVWDDGGGPDFFEVEVGNRVAYTASLGREGLYFQQLRKQWLPYYSEELRMQRLAMTKQACEYDLDHVPFFVERGLYFQAFDRLYKAFQEFLQTLFIRHKVYPIAYNKWIKEQVADLLNLPDLYMHLPAIISVTNIIGSELNQKAEKLNELVMEYCNS